jgi:hypothetical protein
MKSLMKYMVIGCLLFALASCELDNYDAPNKKLSGRITYNGNPINVERGQVRIQLWEAGWQLRTPIDVAIAPDGSYSALLFNGDYKMVIPRGQGPFMSTVNNETQSDTILLQLRGSRDFDIEVMPYYMLHDAVFSSNNGVVSANVAIEKVITDVNAKDIESVGVFVYTSVFASRGMNYNKTDGTIPGSSIVDMNSVDLNVEVRTADIFPSQNYVYATVGLKIAGVEDWIYTPVQRVDL